MVDRLLTLSLAAVVFVLALSKCAFAYEPDAFIRDWRLFGPIPYAPDDADTPDEEAQRAAFAVDYLADQGGESAVSPRLDTVFAVAGAELAWRSRESETDVVDLNAVYGETPEAASAPEAVEYSIAYAWSEIVADADHPALLGVGSDDAVKIWFNGELVHENWVFRGAEPDSDLVPVNLRAGKNTILFKVLNAQLGWGLVCRVLGEETLPERLIQAAQNGNLDSVDMLLTRGAGPNVAIGPGFTALHAAKIAGRADVVSRLVEGGADAHAPMPSTIDLADFLFEEAIKDGYPGAAALVSRDGEILYEKAFGLADVENGVPITQDTKFRIGSITKQFTATAILKLQEDGKLSVKDPLSKFIPDFPRGDEVTVHHLLTHTSGIHSYTSVGSEEALVEKVTQPFDAAELVEEIKGYEFDFEPGEDWFYNNSGYFLLGEIVGWASGKPFPEYLHDTFFGALGMNDTGVHEPNLGLQNEALGYQYTGGEVSRAPDWHMGWAGGAGALYSTVRDLHKWNEAIFNGRVLSRESLDAAFTPAKLNDGKETSAFGAGGYGYGWIINQFRGQKRLSHGGGLHGFVSDLTRYPEKNLTVTVLVNSSPSIPNVNPAGNAQSLAQLFLWEELDPQESRSVAESVDLSTYDDYAGLYDYGNGAILTVSVEDGHLYAQMSNQPRFEIFPESGDAFFWKVVDAQVTFARDENGIVTGATHYQNSMTINATKMDDDVAQVDAATVAEYAGEYDYGALGTLTVRADGARLYAQLAGQPEFEIFPRTETEFFWKVVNATITFLRDESGSVTKAFHDQTGFQREVPKVK